MLYKILVVDDNPNFCQLIAMMLMKTNYEVRTASDVQEAWKRLEEETPDLILCDLMMPEVSGFQFIGDVRQRPGMSHVPIIAVTAIIKQDWFARALRLGAMKVLRKPFSRRSLLIELEEALAKAKA